jgi:RNA polymerase primary sigma factor/RNA polymerase sigma factor
MVKEVKDKMIDICKKYFFDEIFESNPEEVLSPMPDAEKYEILSKEESFRNSDNGMLMLPILSRKQEYHLFRKVNFLKWRIFNKKSPCMEDDFNKMRNIQSSIFSANILLVNYVVGKSKRYKVSKLYGAHITKAVFEEMTEVGYDAVLYAIKLFDFRKGFAFGTYAVNVINSQLANACRTTKNQVFNKTFITGKIPEKSYICDPCERASSNENIDFIRNLIEKLPERDKNIFLGFLDGKTCSQIAKEQGFGGAGTHLRRKKLIKKLRESLCEENFF